LHIRRSLVINLDSTPDYNRIAAGVHMEVDALWGVLRTATVSGEDILAPTLGKNNAR
jgi:hypothetical protein